MLTSTNRIKAWLERLCLPGVSRSTGSQGNQAAAAWCAEQLEKTDWQVRCPTFDCIDWQSKGLEFTVAGNSYEAYPSPYTLGCQVRAPLVAASTLNELLSVDAGGALLLLNGDLAREQLMPHNFPFYNPDEHQAIYRALDALKPAAVIAATVRNPELVGAQYPFPLIEDGDCNIPSIYMTSEEGQHLAAHLGEEAQLNLRAERIPAKGCNVIATLGDPTGQRIVLTAHLDAHIGSPGATDDASGVITLMVLAEMLSGWIGTAGLEIALLNGEDYYASSGEKLWLAENTGRFSQILLAINLDDVAYIKGRTAYSFYECPDLLTSTIRTALGESSELVEGEPWYQGDHMIMVQQGCPALACTSERMAELMSTITHSLCDTPDQVDVDKMIQLATSLHGLLIRLTE
jgi:aminopeptidase YwaD